MTSQTRHQIIAIHTLPNISRCKDNQAVKYGQLWNIAWEIFFFKNHAENEVARLVSDLFLFFKKTKVVSTLFLTYFGRTEIEHTIKTNFITFKTVLIQRYFQFWFFIKEYGTNFPTTFCVRFFEKNIVNFIFY